MNNMSYKNEYLDDLSRINNQITTSIFDDEDGAINLFINYLAIVR